MTNCIVPFTYQHKHSQQLERFAAQRRTCPHADVYDIDLWHEDILLPVLPVWPAGPQLVQMFIGDGAKMVRDAFALAKEKQPAIIFIDEIDAIGTKRFDSELSGDREVQRTMLELLNQLDGFTSNDNVKVSIVCWLSMLSCQWGVMRSRCSGGGDRWSCSCQPVQHAAATTLQLKSWWQIQACHQRVQNIALQLVTYCNDEVCNPDLPEKTAVNGT